MLRVNAFGFRPNPRGEIEVCKRKLQEAKQVIGSSFGCYASIVTGIAHEVSRCRRHSWEGHDR
eukprot:1984072-Pyramimonas_sp.AAC.4